MSESRDERFPFVRASELSPDQKEGPGWLIEGLWVQGGVGILGGAPKVAKSWLALEIAVAVASGTACLGRFRVERPGPVLLYAAEDAPSIVRCRLEGLAFHRHLPLDAIPIQVITAESMRLDLERDQRKLAETVREVRPVLLVLDPFVRLHRIDENSAAEVSGLLAYLRGLQRSLDLAVVVVHHARKNGSADTPGQTLRGSTDFHAWGDGNLYLRRRDAELILTIEHRCAASPDPLLLRLCDEDPDAVHLELVGKPPDAEPSTLRPLDLEERVLERIRLGSPRPLTRSALRQHLHIRNERLGHVLGSLEAQGRIQRGGEGWIFVAPAEGDAAPG